MLSVCIRFVAIVCTLWKFRTGGAGDVSNVDSHRRGSGRLFGDDNKIISFVGNLNSESAMIRYNEIEWRCYFCQIRSIA